MSLPPAAGSIVIADLNPTRGHEQGGRRPVAIVSHRRYSTIPGLVLGIPITSTDRGLPHHVPLAATRVTGLQKACFAMTEQVRTLSHHRLSRRIGELEADVMEEICRWVHLFIA